VIWATGFGLDHSWIQLPVFDQEGEVAHERGVTTCPGLYFLGLPWQHTRGSALLGWVKDDAEYLVQHISTQQRSVNQEPKMTPDDDQFPTVVAGLPACDRPDLVELSDGELFDLKIGPVVKRIGEATVRMLAYNGSVPGPTLKVQQGSNIEVDVINDGDLEATVHWHGLRLENRYDGTHETQEPIQVGGSARSRVTFPDPGLYWYHPHIREDYGQEMGLYGNVLVVPSEPDYWAAVHREVLLTLDDILIEDGKVAPFSRSQTTHTAMGRFGNVLLVGGEPDLALTVRRCEVVRLYLTNTANTRVFKVRLPGARMKLVGGDSGRVEREQFVDDVVLAPSERVIVDVLFDQAGQLTLQHVTPDRIYPLAAITVTNEPVEPGLTEQYESLRTDPELASERRRLGSYLAATPDKTLAFVAEMDMGDPDVAPGATLVYTCPMHPDVTSEQPGRCPDCGMKLLATEAPAAATGYACPMHPAVVSDEPSRCPECGMKLVPAALVSRAADDEVSVGDPHRHTEPQEHHGQDHGHAAAGGIEWEDDMVEINKQTTPANVRWKLIDRATDTENTSIDWQFRVGDRVKIRLVNEMDSDHPMHHPFHIHGAGRFLTLARDDVVEPNLVWSDTVLVRTGETVDILLDVTNPGRWMAHCHIAEHHESGMMFSFNVTP
jgi:FtsP/CotA-like multicopper oxidase with cupredoxin domain